MTDDAYLRWSLSLSYPYGKASYAQCLVEKCGKLRSDDEQAAAAARFNFM
ncbi:MAG: hypothetical protein V7K21_05480 [Nostoc sp.]